MTSSAINNHKYQPPFFLFNTHLETMYPALFRRVNHLSFDSFIISTPDKDQLEIDVHKRGNDRAVILCHGLEGNSKKAYILGMARAFNNHGWDAITWNYRGCGEQMNKTKIFYHSGATYDLQTVLDWSYPQYKEILLLGFSLGGNLILKYLGDSGSSLSDKIVGGIAFSAPIDLHMSSLRIEKKYNYPYSRRFLRQLFQKVRDKEALMPGTFNLNLLSKTNTVFEFDENFTAPLHGFKSAVDYYKKCSALFVLDRIKRNTLLVNALNDTFLSKNCISEELFHINKYLTFETPDRGGHVGFSEFGRDKMYWSERRAVDFANKLMEV